MQYAHATNILFRPQVIKFSIYHRTFLPTVRRPKKNRQNLALWVRGLYSSQASRREEFSIQISST